MFEWMVGRIEQQALNQALPVYRVRLADGQLTHWLPKLVAFADASTSDKPLGVNTQVVVLLSEERETGVILGALNSLDSPNPSDQDTLHRSRYADGAVIEYDAQSHQLNAILPSGATTHLTSTGGVTVDGDTTINGNLTVNGNASITGSADIGGDTTIGGNLTLSGNGTVGGNFSISGVCAVGGLAAVGGGAVSASGGMSMTGGDITVDGISVKTHTHPENGTGGGTTGVPQ